MQVSHVLRPLGLGNADLYLANTAHWEVVDKARHKCLRGALASEVECGTVGQKSRSRDFRARARQLASCTGTGSPEAGATVFLVRSQHPFLVSGASLTPPSRPGRLAYSSPSPVRVHRAGSQSVTSLDRTTTTSSCLLPQVLLRTLINFASTVLSATFRY